MARKRKDNKKWRARSSRQKSHRKKKSTQKPCHIRKNNFKASRSTKPSQQRSTKIDKKINSSAPSISLETQLTEEVFDTRIIHNFLSKRYLSEVRQVWLSCQCCMCEHPE
ncbi:unnamed protein product [Adineta steineri]|uniref:Uncharacterized protein n=1 Tax=Adineta steineri TaxID=433720 RepID=A0A820KBE9_9BILA|nr:unnamed protein product [Adineta steineri]